jgi:uncharacterized protein (TIGR02271 family)
MDERNTEEQDAPAEVVLHEEQIAGVDRRWHGVGYVRARKRVETVRARQDVDRQREQVELERLPAQKDDSGKVETLPDGSISIPVFEEELVVTKRTVLRERVVVRKHVITEHKQVRERLQKERVTFDADESTGFIGEPAREGGSGHPATARAAETRPFFLTSEFAAAVLGVAALVASWAADLLGAWQTWILVAAVATGYVLSRGLAKAHTPSHARDPRERLARPS